MTAYHFRFLNEAGQPTGWIGMAVAPSLGELYWQIDRHGDPNSCQVKTVMRSSFCALLADDSTLSETEFDDSDQEETKWRDPRWPSNVAFLGNGYSQDEPYPNTGDYPEPTWEAT